MTRLVPSSRAARVLRRKRRRQLRWYFFWPLIAVVCLAIVLFGPSIVNPAQPTELGPATSVTKP